MVLAPAKRKLSLIALAAIAAGGSFYAYRTISAKPEEIRYVSAAAEKGTLIVSVSGSGQVASSNQIDIKPKASGDLVSVVVKDGQEVRAGALIAQVNARDAIKALRDAEVSLETARLNLEKVKEPADALSVLQSENSLLQAQESLQKSKDNLQTTFEDMTNDIADAFLDLPTVMTGLQDILYSNTASPAQSNIDYYKDTAFRYDTQATAIAGDAAARYGTARSAYDANFTAYKNTSRSASEADLEALINQTYSTTVAMSDAIKSVTNLVQFYSDTLTQRGMKPIALANTHLSNLKSYTGIASGHSSGLLSTRNSLKNDRDAIRGAERSIVEKTQSLAKLKQGPAALDLRSQEISIKEREYSLQDARAKLADYTVRAPFDGVIVDLAVKKGDSVSSGTVIVTLMAKQQHAELSLNELDASKIIAGQKATLTFDAVDGLTISGEVAEIDAIGTVTQGVVNYDLKVGFDTQDPRIKPGMSVTASIVTEMTSDVLLVPNAAIKYQGDLTYVEVLANEDASVPEQKPVVIGLANDTHTEIVSGLEEGDLVVTQTIRPTAVQATNTATRSIFPATQTQQRGGTGGAGGRGGTFQQRF